MITIEQFMIAVLTILLSFSLLREAYAKLRRRLLWRDRQVLSFEDIYNLYYADQAYNAYLIKTAWRELGRALSINAGRLRPDDRLDQLARLYKTPFDDFQARLSGMLEYYLPEHKAPYTFEAVDDLIHSIGKAWLNLEWNGLGTEEKRDTFAALKAPGVNQRSTERGLAAL